MYRFIFKLYKKTTHNIIQTFKIKYRLKNEKNKKKKRCIFRILSIHVFTFKTVIYIDTRLAYITFREIVHAIIIFIFDHVIWTTRFTFGYVYVIGELKINCPFVSETGGEDWIWQEFFLQKSQKNYCGSQVGIL